MKSPETIAIDLGGTWLRMAVANSDKRSVTEWKRKAVLPSRLPALLKHVWKQMGWNEAGRLIVGSKGVWTPPERQELFAKLKGLAEIVTVMSDVELALWGAFVAYPQTSQRVLLVAGTGSIAVGLTARGKLVRAGGMGPPKGDAGSGWWIGKEFLRGWPRNGKNRSTQRPSVRQIARLAKSVVAHASIDPLCSKIVQSAQGHLAQLVNNVSQKMKSRSPIFVSWGGSLLENETFRGGVLSILQKQFPHRFRFVTPENPPAQTAAQTPWAIPQRMPYSMPPRFLTKKKRRPFSQNPTANFSASSPLPAK